MSILVLLILLNCGTYMTKAFKTNQDENETKKAPIEQLEGVLGQRAEMPCDISVSRRDDAVYMVLWFSEPHGKPPIYSFDVRGRGMKTAKVWSSAIGFDRRADFQPASHPAHLLVSDLKIRDQGLYRCRVDFRNSRTRNSLVNLTVVVPPSSPIIYDRSDEEVSTVGPLLEGSDVLLKCRVRGGNPEPTVSWYVNGALIDSTSYVNGYGDVVNELLFQKVNRSHINSQFTCKASNTRLVQPVEVSVQLDLNLKPLFVRFRQKQADRILAGKEYRLSCETAGSKPPAELRWIKDGKEMTQAITQELDGGNVTSSTFVFIPSPKDNGGSITCRAENPKLNRTHILEEVWNLNVVYQPEVKLSLGSTLNPYEIKEGTDVYLDCRVQANPKVTKLIWLLNGEELKHTIGAGIIMSNQSLVLQGISRSQNGNYCCIATNAEGSTTSNEVLLNVLYTPVCLAKNGVTVGATKGESVGLRCAVEANPTAFRFGWEFHGTSDSLDIVTLGKTVSLADLSRFFYTPQTDSEFGTFLCWGSNSIGRQVQPCVFHVVAAVKPHPLENCSVANQTGTTIQVECSSHRELPPIPDQPLFRIMNGLGEDGTEASRQDPIEYGLFPEFYICEVWDIKNRSVRRNLSSETPVFILKGLGPGAWLRFILYAANSHGKSDPVTIEAQLGGDVERQALGERRNQIEFYPVVAIGVGMAVTGTLLTLVLALILRSRRFCLTSSNSSSILRANGTNSTNCEKNRHGTNFISPQVPLTATTTSPNNSAIIGFGGYRALPQSKNEADANPDIIPGANSFPTDYDEDVEKSLLHRTVYLQHPPEHGQHALPALAFHGNPNLTLPNSGTYLSSPFQEYHNTSLERSSRAMHYSSKHQAVYRNALPSKTPNCYVGTSPEFPTSSSATCPADYNTIYIRDKLFHDTDIPESCV